MKNPDELKIPAGWPIHTPGSVAEVFDLFRTLNHGDWVFRGEAGVFESRVSSLARKIDKKASREALAYSESLLVQLFERHAFPMLRMQEHEFRDNIIDKIILMQHHGAPTSLLDWSYSPWVSLYHALGRISDRDDVSVIWCVNTSKCFESRPDSWTDSAMELFRCSTISQYKDFLEKTQPFCVFFNTDVATERMLAQQSTFSYASPTLSDHTAMIASVSPECGSVILVEGRHLKRQLMLELARANIVASTMFPTLDGVGRLAADQLDWGLPQTVGVPKDIS